MGRRLLVLVGVMALLVGLAVLPAGAAHDEAGRGADVRLQAGSFNPTNGERLATPPGLSIGGYAPGVHGYYLVQFVGPIQQDWKDGVVTAGGEVLGYVPDLTLKVRMTPAATARVADVDGVAWVGVFQPAYKLSPSLSASGEGVFRVRVERGADMGRATAAINRSGGSVLSRSGGNLLVAADASALDAVARVLDVAWIEPYSFKHTHNEQAGGVIMGADAAIASGYDGSTQIAAVADTGIGDGTAAGAHLDIPSSRITAIYDWSAGNARQCYRVRADGPQDVDSGHGTHTAVSVLGDGGAGGVGRGNAPAASLVFQAVEDFLDVYGLCGASPDGYYLIGLPEDLRGLYQEAYDAGARIHSNSWGSDASGAYTLDSANTDDFVWDNPDMAITFSAGNDGTDANANGVVDGDSLGSPATAKNVISVGASENARSDAFSCDASLPYTSRDAYQPGETCSTMGAQNLLGTWGQRYPDDFPAAPLSGDTTAGNADQMAAWSSRGPADDGRIKPDVVAPGTWVLSGYSSRYQEGYGSTVNPRNGLYQWDGWGMPASSAYKYMGGTSMSNPLVAGAATVVRDYYQKAHGHQASAALVKARLINSAVDLADENNDGADDNDFPIPNVHEGWGRVDLAAATDPSHLFIDDVAGIGTGSLAVHGFEVTSGGAPFKVSLVWSDYPSTETAAVNLVNDLDLVVTAPDGTEYGGNVFAGGWSQTGGSSDTVNNVENVFVDSANSGTWTVTVEGANVPFGPQPFALVADGEVASADTAPAVSIVRPADAATVSATELIQIAASDEDPPGSLDVEWNIDGGPSKAASYNSGTGYYEAAWDTTTVSDGPHVVEARGTDSALQTGTDANDVTVSNAALPATHVGDLDGSTVPGRGGKWDVTVDIAVHGDGEGAVAGATVTGAWSNGASGSTSCITNGSGTCSVTKTNVRRQSTNVTFTVTGVAAAGYDYEPGDNHDPDGDSTGTAIVVPAP